MAARRDRAAHLRHRAGRLRDRAVEPRVPRRLTTRALPVGAVARRRLGHRPPAVLPVLHGEPVTRGPMRKVALVTGGGRGIGREIALALGREGCAAAVAGKGVTVNAICPGFAATELTWRSARNIAAKTGKSFDDAVAALARLNPGGRLIEPAEVAGVAVKLLHDDATNGEAIVLDGTPS